MKETPAGKLVIRSLTHRIIILACMLLVLVFAWYVRDILAPFVFAAVLAYIIHPVIDSLERLGVGRVWSILGLYLLILLVILAAVLLILPVILDEAQRVGSDFPRYQQHVLDFIDRVEKTYARVNIPDSLRKWPEQVVTAIQQRLPGIVQATVAAVVGSVNSLVTVFMSALLTFYLLKDWRDFSRGLMGLVPEQWQRPAHLWSRRVDRVLSGYIRGQLTVALIVGTVTGIALQLLGMRYSLIVAVVGGLGTLVPYLGPIVGGGLGLLLAGFQSWVMVLKVLIVFIVVQQLEGSILSPNIMKHSVGIHPFWVIFSLLAGGALFGFWGVVAAVPTAAVMRETLNVYREVFEVDD